MSESGESGSVQPQNEDQHDNELVLVSKQIRPYTVTSFRLTPQCILMGTSSGHLLVFNRKLAKLPKPIYCTPSSVTSMDDCISSEGTVHIVMGHQSGTVSFIRLPSAFCPKLELHFEEDTHRSHSIDVVLWTQTGGVSKVFSCDSEGLIIISRIDFDTKQFSHTYFHSHSSHVRHMDFFDRYLYLSSGKDLSFLHVDVGGEVRSLDSITDVVGLHAIQDDLILVSSTEVRVLQHCSKKEGGDGNQLKLTCDSKVLSSIFNKHSSVLALLFENKAEIREVITWGKQWEFNWYQIRTIRQVDLDGSLFYFANNSLHRVSRTAPSPELLLEPEPAPNRSVFSDLLGSPKKILNLAAIQKAGTAVNNVVATAVDYSSQAEVPRLLEDGLQKMNISGNLAAVVQSVQEYVDTTNTNSIIEGVPYIVNKSAAGRRNSKSRSMPQDEAQPAEECGRDSAVSVKRKVVGKGKKRIEPAEMEDPESTDSRTLTEPVSEDVLRELRKEVLGFLDDVDEDDSRETCSPTFLESSESEDQNIGNSPPPTTTTQTTTVAPSSSVSQEEGSVPVPDYLIHEETKEWSKVKNDSRSMENEEIEHEPADSYQPKGSDVVEEDLFEEDQSINASLAYDILLQQSNKNEVVAENSVLSPPAAVGESRRRSLIRKSVRVNDNCDIWTKVSVPCTVKYFAVSCTHILICHRKKAPRLLSLGQLGKRNCSWQQQKWNAQAVEIGVSNPLLLRLDKGRLYYSREELTSFSPINWTSMSVTGEVVLEAQLLDTDLWYICEGSGLLLVMEVPDQCIPCAIDCEWPLLSLAVTDGAVWAIRQNKGTLVVRVGLNKCRMGYDWIEIRPEGPSPLVTVALFESTGFALDDEGSLWMVGGVDKNHPYGVSDAWFRVCQPWCVAATKVPVEQWQLRVCAAGVFLCAGKEMYLATTSVSGHKFCLQIPPKYDVLDNFSLISATSFSMDEDSLEADSIYLGRPNSEIFVYRPRRKNLATLTLPQGCCAVVSISCFESTVSIVDSGGTVWSKTGDHQDWHKEESLKTSITSFTASPLSTWAVTSEGEILCRSPGVDETWQIVAGPQVADQPRISRVYCSPNGRYVWVDNGKRGWARTDVTSRMPSGVKWTETHHSYPLTSFAVGDDVIFSLTEDGQLLRLKGLAAGNPAGNYWKTVGTGFRSISVDAHSGLWAINSEDRLVRHLIDIFPPVPRRCSSSTPGSFEMV